ncbi:hypothetical protein GCM10009841_06620 [Microlunatus panaciterrae]|uniref:Phage tail sheath family protein n=1 Tax=Microlunatus panaciterrae TaxID=400768 RepID=A0ABS2RI69_9ACTN|nr:phage tail sheath C-terminal domain-containing protein [Microlunatus panaciterrae]MBM7798684.1 hypothetical protein [Microlunatus panaciterrae]
MPIYRTPGVYVEEVPSKAHPIESTGTSTPAFIGTGGKPDAPSGPVAITNWSQFANTFLGEGPMTPLAHAVNGFFLNGGSRCYILDIGPSGTLTGTAERPGLAVLEAIEEVAIVAAPGFTDPADYDALMTHCELMRDRLAILDPKQGIKDLMSLTRVAGVEVPDSDATPAADAGEGGGQHPPRRSGEPDADAPRPSLYSARYYPWLVVMDLNTGKPVLAPPSGHMAGVWARTDSLRGVHKAPANEVLRGVVGVERRVTPAEQGELNSAGVNVIRFFDRLGIRPWGARTGAGPSAPEWRYLPVRRLFCMVEESIAQGTSWIVFEPNDRLLWNLVKADVSAFLTRLWRDGALMGRTPAEAFYVKCDEETNPPEEIDAGRLTVEIGMAPVKPAEFIVFQVCQFSGGTITEEGSSRG